MCYCESACCGSITRINTRGTYSYKNRMLRGRESTEYIFINFVVKILLQKTTAALPYKKYKKTLISLQYPRII